MCVQKYKIGYKLKTNIEKENGNSNKKAAWSNAPCNAVFAIIITEVRNGQEEFKKNFNFS